MNATPKADIAIAGLAVMGANLALNMEDKGFCVALYNRSAEKTRRFMQTNGKDKHFIAVESLEELVRALKPPRRVMLMVKAGNVVDDLIRQLVPLLASGDIIIDGGNSHYDDTTRRARSLKDNGILYIGAGVSGGEEGALTGPAIMPGGRREAWPYVRPIFQAIAAKVSDGLACCDWIGAEGAGHFVKMVHNGIEYGDMQLICEAYHLLKDLADLSAEEMHRIFTDWNRGRLNSYLIEITAQILAAEDTDGTPLIDKILDCAMQKGTGKWTAAAALDLGVPLPLIAEAVFARSLAARKAEREIAATHFGRPRIDVIEDKNQFIHTLADALFAAKIISYAQGFSLLKTAQNEYGWQLNPARIAQIWRGGCIIRSAFLDNIAAAFTRKPDLSSLLFDPFFKATITESQQALRTVCAEALLRGIPIPAFAGALTYFDGLTTARLPANLLQAQRDFFGAHRYERVDRPRGEFFHTDWTGRGGDISSTVYGV